MYLLLHTILPTLHCIANIFVYLLFGCRILLKVPHSKHFQLPLQVVNWQHQTLHNRKTRTTRPPSPLKRLTEKLKFHLNVLMRTPHKPAQQITLKNRRWIRMLHLLPRVLNTFAGYMKIYSLGRRMVLVERWWKEQKELPISDW